MTVGTLADDAPVQMARVGLPGFRWTHSFSRSRKENLERAAHERSLRTSGSASCQAPPTAAQLGRLVAACKWDAVLFELAQVLAARRTAEYARRAREG